MLLIEFHRVSVCMGDDVWNGKYTIEMPDDATHLENCYILSCMVATATSGRSPIPGQTVIGGFSPTSAILPKYTRTTMVSGISRTITAMHRLH